MYRAIIRIEGAMHVTLWDLVIPTNNIAIGLMDAQFFGPSDTTSP